MMSPPGRQPKPKEENRRPDVVFQPQTGKGLMAGMDLILNAVTPTLGPLPRTVSIERIASSNSLPEQLDSGGTIARRVIQVLPRGRDVGAMFARNVLWTQQERSGDGTATTAAIFQALMKEGYRYVVNGGDPMTLRRTMESFLPAILSCLDQQTSPLKTRKELADMALSICHNPQLARYLGEIFDIIGEDGRLEIRNGRSREIEREYVEGLWWDTGVVSREMIFDKSEARTAFEDASILVSDFKIEEPDELVPLLNLCVGNGIKSLLLICASISDRALGLLLLKPNLERLKVMAVKKPGLTILDQHAALEDIAVLCGGRALLLNAGDRLDKVRVEDLGRARRVWGKKENFGFSAGAGDPRVLRQHIATLRKAAQNVDAEDRKVVQKRISRLLGGSATLWAGANTPIEVDALKDLTERTAEALRGAMREGSLPGGGAALLACRAVLEDAIHKTPDSDEAVAARILRKGLEAPFRVILENAGFLPEEYLPQVNQKPAGWGMDVLKGEVVDMREAGIVDAAAVVKTAVRSAISSAALALTLDVVVQRRKPPEVIKSTE